MSSEPIYRLRGVGKTFETPTERLDVLKGIDLQIETGESVAILGASGSGKTTLLHMMGTLDAATSGTILFCGEELGQLGESQQARLRNRDIGFVFQFHHLLPEFSALENVAMPAIIGGTDRGEALSMAEEALKVVGLEHRMGHRVTTMSGGERQRAAIARAILRKPKVLLADEPTGNLDDDNGRRIEELLVSLNKELGMTFVVVTHNTDLAGAMGRRLELRSGELYALH